MSKIARKDVERLIELVGGPDNIASVSHCLTRLRFVLNDTDKADTKQLEALPMVKGCFTNAGQFQVVIGTEVDEVYKVLIELSGKSEASKDESKNAARQNMNIVERGISHLAEIFVPLLPAIITGGLILGFRNVIGDIKMFDGQTLTEISQFWATVHSFLWLIGEAIFFFLPVGVCWSTVKKLGGTPILGITLGVTLVSPQLASELWEALCQADLVIFVSPNAISITNSLFKDAQLTWPDKIRIGLTGGGSQAAIEALEINAQVVRPQDRKSVV